MSKIVQIVAAASEYGFVHFHGQFVPLKILVWGLDEDGKIHGYYAEGGPELIRADTSKDFAFIAQNK
jgi:hypothetical protein